MSPHEEKRLSLARENIYGKNYHAAAVTLQGLADEGVALAQSMLGLLYAQGKGVGQDFGVSVELFAKAAAQGDPDGQYYMGYSYLEGSGVEADPVTALAWFIQAAARDHEQAILERDKGFAALDETRRVQANARSRDLGPPMPAGWLRDTDSGIAFWSPSWYRNGTYKVKVDAPSLEGYAHGEGKVRLTASLPGDTDGVFEGVFSNGILFAGEPLGFPFEMLETDDFLVDLSERLPADFPGSTLWLRRRLDGAKVTLRPGGSPDLMVVVNDDFPAHDESAVAAISRTALSVVMELCPLNDNAHATVTTIPLDHQREFKSGELMFEPRQAQIWLSDFGGDPSTWSVNVRNLSAAIEAKRLRLEEERLEKAEHEARRQQHKRAAAMRGMPDVRGIRLGMSLGELHELFEGESESWEPRWLPDRKMPAFTGFTQSFQLEDGAKITAKFTSPVNGSKLFSFGYEQTLRNGPSVDTLKADLKAKYGEPDEVDWRGNVWTYHLVSQRPKRAAGAWMRLRYLPQASDGSAAVTHFSIGINDYGLGDGDESDAYDARLAAAREAEARKTEENKSDKLKF